MNPMKSYKSIFSIIVIFYIISSCSTSFHKQYYQKIAGAWTINDFEHINHIEDTIIDLRRQYGYYIMGLENHNHMYFVKRESREDISVRATYEIFKQNDTLKLRIEKSDDVRIEGVYDLYIDTLGQTDMHYRVQLSLDSEKTYLSALRMKSKPAPKITQ